MQQSKHFIFTIFVFLFLTVACQSQPDSQNKSEQNKLSEKTNTSSLENESKKFSLKTNDSLLETTSYKDNNIPVKGVFRNISGEITQKNSNAPLDVEIVVELSSWDSGLPLRDTRVQKFIFNAMAPQNPKALFKISNFKQDDYQKILKKELTELEVKASLTMLGQTQEVLTTVVFDYDSDLEILKASTKAPIFISMKNWNLEKSKNDLMKACSHRELSDSVEVRFNVVFE